MTVSLYKPIQKTLYIQSRMHFLLCWTLHAMVFHFDYLLKRKSISQQTTCQSKLWKINGGVCVCLRYTKTFDNKNLIYFLKFHWKWPIYILWDLKIKFKGIKQESLSENQFSSNSKSLRKKKLIQYNWFLLKLSIFFCILFLFSFITVHDFFP